MSKPVELIVTNALHTCAAKEEGLPAAIRSVIAADAARHQRELLSNIACDASLATILKMLAAAGAPATLDEIGRRFEAVCEGRTDAGLATPHSEMPDAAMNAITELLSKALGPGVGREA